MHAEGYVLFLFLNLSRRFFRISTKTWIRLAVFSFPISARRIGTKFGDKRPASELEISSKFEKNSRTNEERDWFFYCKVKHLVPIYSRGRRQCSSAKEQISNVQQSRKEELAR